MFKCTRFEDLQTDARLVLTDIFPETTGFDDQQKFKFIMKSADYEVHQLLAVYMKGVISRRGEL